MIALKGLGHFTYGRCSKPVKRTTIYDLASVTKVWPRLPHAWSFTMGEVPVEQPLVTSFPTLLSDDNPPPEGDPPYAAGPFFRLPAVCKAVPDSRYKDELLQQEFLVPLTADPGTRAEYSDIASSCWVKHWKAGR